MSERLLKHAKQMLKDQDLCKWSDAHDTAVIEAIDAALYAVQPPQDERGQPVALTDEQIEDIYRHAQWDWGGKGDVDAFFLKFARKIERWVLAAQQPVALSTLTECPFTLQDAPAGYSNEEASCWSAGCEHGWNAALAASASALQAGQGEPVAWQIEASGGIAWQTSAPTKEHAASIKRRNGIVTPLYTSSTSQPVAAEGVRADVVPLSEEQLARVCPFRNETAVAHHWKLGFRSAEQHHGIAASQDSAKGGKP